MAILSKKNFCFLIGFLFLGGCVLDSRFQSLKVVDSNSTENPDNSSPPSTPPVVPVTPSNPVYVCVGGPTVFSTNMNARYVIGQPDFVSNSANQGGGANASTLSNPIGIAVDNGKLYIADAGNNRVLVYNNLPTSNGASADLVIGQPDFASTSSGTATNKLNGIQSISADENYLAVAEWSNSRVSLWPLSNPTVASIFLGQPDGNSLTVNNGGLSDKSMGAAAGVAFSSGKLFVGDVTNSRVLVFNSSTLATFASAQFVIGQSNFTSSSVGSGLSGFGANYSVSPNGSKIVIMDNNSDRVLFYNSVPTVSGALADFEWGGWGVADNRLNNPVGVFFGRR